MYNRDVFLVRVIAKSGKTILHSRMLKTLSHGKPFHIGRNRAYTIDGVLVAEGGKDGRAQDSGEKQATIVSSEDEEAQRIAKAIVRAAELCGARAGGEDKDPFK